MTETLCLSCVIEATDQLDDGPELDVPDRPVVVWQGRSWCVDHWLRVLLPCAEEVLEGEDD